VCRTTQGFATAKAQCACLLGFGARVVMHSRRTEVKRDFSDLCCVVYRQAVNDSLAARQVGAGMNDRSMNYDMEGAKDTESHIRQEKLSPNREL